MEPVNIETVSDWEQEIIYEKKEILYKYESRGILRADHKTLKTNQNRNWGNKNIHAYVLYNQKKFLQTRPFSGKII